MECYGYRRVSVRELEDKHLGLQVERLVHACITMGIIPARAASVSIFSLIRPMVPYGWCLWQASIQILEKPVTYAESKWILSLL